MHIQKAVPVFHAKIEQQTHASKYLLSYIAKDRNPQRKPINDCLTLYFAMP